MLNRATILKGLLGCLKSPLGSVVSRPTESSFRGTCIYDIYRPITQTALPDSLPTVPLSPSYSDTQDCAHSHSPPVVAAVW